MYLYVYIYIYTYSYIEEHTQNHMSTKENIYVHTKVAQRLEVRNGEKHPIIPLSPSNSFPNFWSSEMPLAVAAMKVARLLNPSIPEFPYHPIDSWFVFCYWKFSPNWLYLWCTLRTSWTTQNCEFKSRWTQNHFSMLLEHTHHDCHIIHVCYLHTMEPSWWQPSPMHLPCTARRRCWWRSFGFGQQAVSGSSTQTIHTCDGGTKSWWWVFF